MKKIRMRTLISFIIILAILLFYFSINIYQRSRAGRISSNQEYLEQLESLAKQRKIPGYPTPTPTQNSENNSTGIEALINWLLNLFSFQKKE